MRSTHTEPGAADGPEALSATSLSLASVSAAQRPSLRELEVLIAVLETGKTTAAAQRLGISQPAVSRALNHLETVTGRRLFTRQGGRIAPTPEAVALAGEAEPIFTILDRISKRDWHGADAGSLRIVAPPTVAHRYLTRVIPRFAKNHPDTRVHLEVATSSDVISAVADGTVDIGIADSLFRHSGVKRVPFMRTRAHVVVARGDPLAARDALTPHDLAGEPFIALTRRFSVRTTIEGAFADARVPLAVVAEAATSAIVTELVAGGMGVGILNPFPVALAAGQSVAFVPFQPEIAYEAAFLVQSRRPSEPAMRFMDFVRQAPGVDGIEATPI